MILPQFEFHQPTSITEAVAIAQSCNGDFDFMSGGTDLLPNYKNRLNARRNVISLALIKELYEVSATRIGAMARLVDIGDHGDLKKKLPVIPSTVSQIATPLIREAGTIGGNILLDTRCFYFNQSWFWRDSKAFCLKADGTTCLVVPQDKVCYATYCGDLAPVLIVLGSSFILTGAHGRREVPAKSFFVHDGIARHVKQREELLSHIAIPNEAQQLRAGYLKLRVRDSMDFPVLGVAAALELAERTIQRLHIALTGVATTPLHFDDMTDALVGDQLTGDLIEHVSDEIMNQVTLYRNVALSPQYRKAMVGVYLRRVLTDLLCG